MSSAAPFSGFLKLLRPRQWTKNLVCIAGAFFGHRILDPHFAIRAVIATAAFCASSSFVYILNDVLDRDRDRNHPRKRLRPIASGQVSIAQALILAVALLALAVGLGALLGPVVLGILGGYAVMNLCYSAALKNLSLVDATVVAMGFILRIYAGTAAVSVSPSAWLLLCAFFLALFLAFGKRRAEINAASGHLTSSRAVMEKYTVAHGEVSGTRTVIQQFKPDADINATRAVLHKYSVTMLDRFCNICATLAIATYALFTVLGHPDDRSLIITTPPVVMGIFRYLLLIERYQEGEAPDAILLKDWAIQLAILIWFILFVAVIYLGIHIDVQ
jgi:4-hydroxybenzoate polyprenyltransferase